MKQLLFGIHLPVMGFDSNGDNNKKNEVQSFTREQILSIARKTESLGFDLLSYTRIHVGA